MDLTVKQKKVLVSYIDGHLYETLSGSIYHTNVLEANQIIKFFIDNDFVIDLIHCQENDFSKIKEKQYDVIFGFGVAFEYFCSRQEKANRILYLTEGTPEFSRNAELKRIEYYYERKNIRCKVSRSGRYFTNKSFENIDYVISLGDVEQLSGLKIKTYSINPTGLLNKKYSFFKRNFDESKKNFLWFGSEGAIHKGLDLLIDAFEGQKDLTLHVCGLIDKEKNLIKASSKNIINHNRIDVNGEHFIELVNKCSYIILPSCSEAMSTSVLTGMLHGLIPIVIEDTGFNKLKDKALFLKNYQIDYIEQELTNISKKSNSELEVLHEDIFKYARHEFSINTFTNNLNNTLSEILEKEN
ncbi:MAG: glycosyltransferase [Pseudomonadales bacterium]|nr:glycosyltransferase [Pseudomonadales bacterium]